MNLFGTWYRIGSLFRFSMSCSVVISSESEDSVIFGSNSFREVEVSVSVEFPSAEDSTTSTTNSSLGLNSTITISVPSVVEVDMSPASVLLESVLLGSVLVSIVVSNGMAVRSPAFMITKKRAKMVTLEAILLKMN